MVLPPEISVLPPVFRLCIKGNFQDDAILCTASKSFSLRSITLSNTLLLTTANPQDSTSESLVVRYQASEILELLPTVPKLGRIDSMLKGSLYDEPDEGMDKLNHIVGHCLSSSAGEPL